MSQYDLRAKALQEAVWADICGEQKDLDFEDTTVRTAVVHARLDLVLLASHLSSLNGQVATVVALVAYATFR